MNQKIFFRNFIKRIINGITKVNKKKGLFRRNKCRRRNAAVNVFLEETSNEYKFEFLDHIFSCPECSRDFDALLDIWRKDKELLAGLETVHLTKEQECRIRKMVTSELKKLDPMNQKPRKLTLFPLKTLTAAAAILLIVLMTWFFFNNPEKGPMERTAPKRAFHVVEPMGRIDHDFLEFRWDSIKGARDYTLEILNQRLELLFRRQNIGQNKFLLPKEDFQRFQKGKIYFWKVTVYLKTNHKIESEFGKFILPSGIS